MAVAPRAADRVSRETGRSHPATISPLGARTIERLWKKGRAVKKELRLRSARSADRARGDFTSDRNEREAEASAKATLTAKAAARGSNEDARPVDRKPIGIRAEPLPEAVLAEVLFDVRDVERRDDHPPLPEVRGHRAQRFCSAEVSDHGYDHVP